MSARAAVIFSSLLAASSVALGVWLGLLPALMVVLVLALLFCYARFFKKSPLANLIVSLTAGLSFVFGGIVAENIFCLIPFIFAILIHMPREIIKDVIDLKGDRASGVRSLPVLWGEKNSLRLAGLFLLMLVFLTPLPYFMNIMGIAYLVVVIFCALPLLVLLAIAAMRTPTPRSLRMQSNTIKLVMGIGLFAFLCG
jgi:geranylgeranylglycerol-phosphate geranylgeranyltransferase